MNRMIQRTTSITSGDSSEFQRRQFLRKIGAAATVPLFGPLLSHAQPQSSIVRIVIPFPAGSPPETGGRMLALALKQTSGRNYIVDNKPGAGGLLGADEVAKAKPDGSVLLYMTASHTSNAALYAKLPYDPVKDFTAISQVLTAPGLALLVRPDSPYRSVQDLIKAAQQKPDSVTYASLGMGQTGHIMGALFGHAVKANFLHIPYRSSPLPDLLGGHVDFTWLGTPVVIPLINSGRVRVLAVSNERRLPEAPDAPTLAELGATEVDVPAWTGVLGPRGMSSELANRIHAEIVAATKHPDFLEYIKKAGNDVVTTTPSQFASYLGAEVDKYRRVLPPLGIKLEAGS